MNDRAYQIQEWRHDLLTLYTWAGLALLSLFVLLALWSLVYGALQGVTTQRKGKR